MEGKKIYPLIRGEKCDFYFPTSVETLDFRMKTDGNIKATTIRENSDLRSSYLRIKCIIYEVVFCITLSLKVLSFPK